MSRHRIDRVWALWYQRNVWIRRQSESQDAGGAAREAGPEHCNPRAKCNTLALSNSMQTSEKKIIRLKLTAIDMNISKTVGFQMTEMDRI